MIFTGLKRKSSNQNMLTSSATRHCDFLIVRIFAQEFGFQTCGEEAEEASFPSLPSATVPFHPPALRQITHAKDYKQHSANLKPAKNTHSNVDFKQADFSLLINALGHARHILQLFKPALLSEHLTAAFHWACTESKTRTHGGCSLCEKGF